ncbi:MAG: hypothetical protein ABR956_16280 [Terracidiphilus sp.]|jgi:hypothetical protein
MGFSAILKATREKLTGGFALSMGKGRKTVFALLALITAALFSPDLKAQAALLMEQPYGVFGVLNPTGHNAIYFERVCAETPVKLRRCAPGELGAVIARYQGIDGYDWVAMPLIPYLYSVENASEVPAHVDREQVKRMRDRYREAHLQSLGEDVFTGNFVHGGWTQLLGMAYERRIYALRFQTTPEQDDAIIAQMNNEVNRSHFELLYNNCADFARRILNTYYSGAFGRSLFPDAGVTTPKQITWKLARYARKHPQMQLAVFEIPQVPGYRRLSHSNKSIAESLTTTAYAVPIVLVNPYLAGGIFVDYLVRGRFHCIPRHPQVLGPGNLLPLTASPPAGQNPDSADAQATSAVADRPSPTRESEAADSGLKEIKATHE